MFVKNNSQVNTPLSIIILPFWSFIFNIWCISSGRINKLEQSAKKYGWKRGTENEIKERIGDVLKNDYKKGIGYDPVYTNCEHFATHLVFGETHSVQTDHLSQVFNEMQFWKDLGVCLIQNSILDIVLHI